MVIMLQYANATPWSPTAGGSGSGQDRKFTPQALAYIQAVLVFLTVIKMKKLDGQRKKAVLENLIKLGTNVSAQVLA